MSDLMESSFSDSDDCEYMEFEITPAKKRGKSSDDLYDMSVDFTMASYASNRKFTSSLTEIRAVLEETEPDLAKVLGTKLRRQDRAELYHLLRLYKRQKVYTNDWWHYRKKFNRFLETAKLNYAEEQNYSKRDLKRIDKEQKSLATSQLVDLKYRIYNLETSDQNKAVLYRRYAELMNMSRDDHEYQKLQYWFGWALSIPHDHIKEVQSSNVTKLLVRAKKYLDKNVYGMTEVKEQIILFLHAKLTNANTKRGNIALLGSPGTGKTMLARSIAKIMKWGFEQISFGGTSAAEYLKGHDYTYVGSQPGEIVKCLRRMGHKNGVLYLDELDKASDSSKIRSVLLHIIDPSQNMDFRDNFLNELSIDLSYLWYIGSMNKVMEDQALMDRFWVIHVNDYNLQDKINIVRDYLVPKLLKANNIPDKSIVFDEDTVRYMIEKVQPNMSNEKSGIRLIEKSVGNVIERVHFLMSHQTTGGEMPFKVSFDLKQKLEYPLTVTKAMLDTLTLDTSQLTKSTLPFGLYT